MIKLLALYNDPENHNAQRYRQTDRGTRHHDANSRSYCGIMENEERKGGKGKKGLPLGLHVYNSGTSTDATLR